MVLGLENNTSPIINFYFSPEYPINKMKMYYLNYFESDTTPQGL